MLEIKYTKTAFNDLDKIFKLIFEDKKNVAIEYINKLRKYIKLLEKNPYMGVDCKNKNKNINKKCRIIIFESYNIYYSIEKDYIKILKIINAKQLQKK
ncbi:type II toxin-antitoxin system RelE/ParE family toxin [Aliarcobacter skirrowii]|uniref:type II toxin-antitoxin system RelE/ParE family toxin n=1 Tax=Aliarcobacter skirrowii TaxID=28200 RepID=UPI00082CB33F|nr:type II toxin-antitoxin system RelE/ParE family toxin [Aliarcobacter skirrowii]